MSKTWRRHSGWKDNSTWAKRQATKAVRHYPLDGLPSVGREYHKLYEQWNITDWNCTKTPAYQSWVYHNPYLSNVYSICDPNPYRNWTLVDVEAPEPVLVDRNWVLPAGYQFKYEYRKPKQRVNPETGVFEEKIRLSRWVYRHDVAWKFYFRESNRHNNCYYTDLDWHYEEYDAWVTCAEPRVQKYIGRPYFTEDDVRRHVEGRESETRDYRHRNQWPRYWRRDRKRARRMKGAV